MWIETQRFTNLKCGKKFEQRINCDDSWKVESLAEVGTKTNTVKLCKNSNFLRISQ